MSRPGSTSLWRRLKGTMLRATPGMITCAEFERFIIDHLESRLPKAQQARFESHLRICRPCRDYLAAYLRTVEIGKAVFDNSVAPLPDDVPEDLVKAILDSLEV